MIEIDREGIIPMYVQLASALRERIRRGEIPVGRRIPSQNELEQETGGLVSRRQSSPSSNYCKPREPFRESRAKVCSSSPCPPTRPKPTADEDRPHAPTRARPACDCAGWASGVRGPAQLSDRGNVTSTRRFFLRPASVELSAIGYCSP